MDHARLVSEIQSLLNTTAGVPMQTLQDLAAKDAAACSAVNSRLGECRSLLRLGLRSEAIQLAESEPNLLDAVVALDFEGRDVWRQWLADNQLPPPPDLLVEIAAELNEAYAAEQPLAEPLRRHRLLAMARAPVFQRIAVLREIREIDPANPVWQDDLRVLEAVYLEEVEAAAQQAHEAKDLKTLSAIADDLHNGQWVEPPPESVRKRVLELYDNLLVRRARETLDALEPQLNEALAQRDLPRGRALRDRWNEAAQLAQPRAADAPLKRTAAALEWLAAEDRRDASERQFLQHCANLEAAIDGGLPRRSLEKLYAELKRWQLDIPSVTEGKYQRHIQQLDSEEKKRKTGMALCALGGAAVAVLIAVWFVRGHFHEKAVSEQAEKLSAMIEAGELKQARTLLHEYFDDFPELTADSRFDRLEQRLRQLEVDERERSEQYDDAVVRVRASLGGLHPDIEGLATAKRLAKTPQEEREVADLEAQVNAAIIDKDRRREEQFRRRLDELQDRLPKFVAAKGPEGKAGLEKLEAEIDKLLKNNVNVSAAAQRPARELKKEIQSILNRIEQAERFQQDIELLNRTIGVRDKFVEALGVFLRDFPEDDVADELRRVIDEAPLWDAVRAWNEMAISWRGAPVGQWDAKRAADEMKRLQALIETYGDFPQPRTYAKVLPCLMAVAQRTRNAQGKFEAAVELEKLTAASPLLGDRVLMAETVAGARYYYVDGTKDLEKAVRTVRIDWLNTFGAATTKKNFTKNEVKRIVEAPQVALVGQMKKRLGELRDNNWEIVFLDILRNIRDNVQIDAVLKLQLFQLTMDAAVRGSHPLSVALAGEKKILDDARLNLTVRWMDPGNAEANAERGKAEAVVEKLSKWEAIQNKVDAQIKTFHQFHKSLKRHRWIGWLWREGKQWRCNASAFPPQEGKLVVVRRESEERVVFEPVGRLADQQATIDPAAGAASLVAGRPVFLEIAPQAK